LSTKPEEPNPRFAASDPKDIFVKIQLNGLANTDLALLSK
jgi:hypothetical protein